MNTVNSDKSEFIFLIGLDRNRGKYACFTWISQLILMSSHEHI